METSSDQSSEVFPVDQVSLMADFLDYVPQVENVYLYKDEDTRKKVYVKKEGKLFTDGTLNMTDVDSDSQSTRVDLHSGYAKDIEWTHITIGALKQLCSELNIRGRFLRLNKNIEPVWHDEIVFSIVPFSKTPATTKKQFSFLLFEIEFDHNNYYYMDTGPGRYSVLFSSTSYEKMNANRLNLFVIKAINVYDLKWSNIYKKQFFESLDLKIVIFQPIEHTSKGQFDKEEDFIQHLASRIKKRLLT